jgi:hypothetical protein
MYPSRAVARHLAAVGEILDCGRGDRDALPDSADAYDVRPAGGRRARSQRTDPGSTVGHGCSLRKGPDERRNARSFARHRARASETNSEKLAAARASAILRKPLLRILSRMLEQQPEGSERELRAFVLWGGWRSCLEWARQVEFLAGTGSPLVRWKWSPIRPVAAPRSAAARFRGWTPRRGPVHRGVPSRGRCAC